MNRVFLYATYIYNNEKRNDTAQSCTPAIMVLMVKLVINVEGRCRDKIFVFANQFVLNVFKTVCGIHRFNVYDEVSLQKT